MKGDLMTNTIRKGFIIKDTEDRRYMIYDIVNVNEIEYLVCMNIKDSKDVEVFKYRFVDQYFQIARIKDEKLRQEIILKTI